MLTTVTGVAGSGKSTLVSTVLPRQHPDVVIVDQSAIGISLRSVPATYLDVMDPIRAMFAAATGQDAGLFSFNSAGLPQLQGRGIIQTDLATSTPSPRRARSAAASGTGRRPSRTPSATAPSSRRAGHDHRRRAAVFTEPDIKQRLALLSEVGLGYLTLGQPLCPPCRRASASASSWPHPATRDRHRVRAGRAHHRPAHVRRGRLLALMDRLGRRGQHGHRHRARPRRRPALRLDHRHGPEAGRHGGRVVFEGTPRDLLRATRLATPRGVWPGSGGVLPPGGGMTEGAGADREVAEWFQMRVSALRYYDGRGPADHPAAQPAAATSPRPTCAG
ncbi:hypothetical protein [Kutzneria kofuensis]|uniref:hypothetical protein n=1 Tax=Kutzneria kofuensis TaxID=103725 RepID=UPI0031EAF43D